jgi:hypothetical protein
MRGATANHIYWQRLKIDCATKTVNGLFPGSATTALGRKYSRSPEEPLSYEFFNSWTVYVIVGLSMPFTKKYHFGRMILKLQTAIELVVFVDEPLH